MITRQAARSAPSRASCRTATRRRPARGSGITIAAARISTASSTIRRPAWPARTRSTWPDTRLPPATLASSMTLRRRILVGHRRVDLERVRHGDRHQHVDAAALARRQLARRRQHLIVVARVAEVDEHRVVLRLVVDDRLRDRDLVRGGQVEALPAAIDHVDDDAEREPADAEHAHDRVQHRDDDERDEGERPADDREQRRVVAADGRVARAAVGPR